MIDIDKYLNWYEVQTLEAEKLPFVKETFKRVVLICWNLYSRQIRNENTKGFDKILKRFEAYKTELEKHIDKYNVLVNGLEKTTLHPRIEPTYFIPKFKDWQMLEANRTMFLDELKTEIADKLEVLNNDYYKEKIIELEGYINGSHYVQFVNSCRCLPLGLKEKWFDFIMFVHWCDSLKYYNELISEPLTNDFVKLNWLGTNKDLSELAKALSLTALKGTTETTIVNMFEKVFEHNGKAISMKRHNVNINELQDVKPTNYFTSKLHTALKNYKTEPDNE